MKKSLRILVVLLLCIVTHGYGMSGEEHDPALEQAFNPMLIWSRGFQPSYTAPNSSLLPLPPLPTQEEKLDKWIAVHRSLLASADKVNEQQILAGESPLEKLPRKAFQNLMQFLDPKAKQALAIASRTCKTREHATIKAISISIDNITPENLKGAHESYPQVKTIEAYGKNITPKHIRLLATTFPCITSLNLNRVTITAESISALAQPNTFTELKVLDLSNNTQMGDEGIAALTKAPFAHKLESLNVYGTSITATGAIALSQPGIFVSLKELNLSHNAIGDRGLNALIEAPFAKQLEKLSLRNTSLSAEGIAILFKPNKLTALKALTLAQNTAIGDKGLAHLSTAPFAHTLEFLNLEDTGLAAAGIEALTQPEKFTALKSLFLSWNVQIGDADIIALSQAPFAQKLELLDLSSNNLTTAGVMILSQPGIFTALKKLILYRNEAIDDTSIAALIKAPFAGKLEWLNLMWTSVTKTGAQQLLELGIAKQIAA